MLILTRRADEAILIGDNIEILVMDIKGSQVRIGVTAPRDVSVDRKEVAERKAKEAAAASGNQWKWPAAGFRKAEPSAEVRTLRAGIDYDADAVCPGCGCFRDRCACDLRDASTSAREATK